MHPTNPRSNQLQPTNNNLTSVWYTMHEQLYLMHVNDLAVKMGGQNTDLKNNLELYINRAEQIEKDIVDASHPPTAIDTKRLEQYQKQIGEMDAAIEKELEIIKKQENQRRGVVALNNNLWSYIQGQAQIYNDAVAALNTIYSQRPTFHPEAQQIPSQLLILGQDEDDNNYKINRIQQNIQTTKTIIADARQEEQTTFKHNQRFKKTAVDNIKNLYQSRSTVLPQLQRNLQANMAMMQQLNPRKQCLKQLDNELFEAKSNYDRRLISIIELRNIMALKSRESQKKIQKLLWNKEKEEADSANPSQDQASCSDSENKKIVFVKLKPSNQFRVFLVVWFAVLSLAVIHLTA